LPAAALAAEDAELIERLAQSGPVTLRLVLTPRTLPDAESYNIVADWRGSELPEEVVVVSGHLDSWDLGTGAIDDGAGVISAAAVLHILKTLDLHPRRTIRFIAWTNEENGDRGGRAYVDSVANNIASQFAAIESDLGAGKVLGIDAAVTSESLAQFEPLMQALAPIGATVLSRIDSEAGSDIAGLQQLGVPGFAPSVDARHYFDYHHTAADTLDKVDPAMLREQVATLAALAYHLAQMPGPLPRLKIAE
jgi:Zn-dependent M28 family amino/carboxypeptidase